MPNWPACAIWHLCPCSRGGRLIGYLQLSNHRNGSVAIFGRGTAPGKSSWLGRLPPSLIMPFLFKYARQRGQRSESLRRIASLVASSAALDEVLQFSVQELTQLLRADVAAIYLLDEQDPRTARPSRLCAGCGSRDCTCVVTLGGRGTRVAPCHGLGQPTPLPVRSPELG